MQAEIEEKKAKAGLDRARAKALLQDSQMNMTTQATGMLEEEQTPAEQPDLLGLPNLKGAN